MNTLKQERNKKVHCLHFIIFISKQDNKTSLQNRFGEYVIEFDDISNDYLQIYFFE